MKIPPEDAVSLSGRSFVEFFMSQAERTQPGGSELCSSSTSASWSALLKAQCEEGKPFCWMSCLDLPANCSLAESECLNVSQEPCYTEDVTTDCKDMDPTCSWQCKPQEEEKYCVGSGTDMFMQGFALGSNGKNPCVILLFHSWILDSRAKFIIGCFGVVFLGIGIEGLLCVRRSIQNRKILLKISSIVRRVLIVLMYGVNVCSGYFAMLVAMTYSVELFTCMIVGLVLGHALFNSEAAVGESVDPCCASQTIAPTQEEDQDKMDSVL